MINEVLAFGLFVCFLIVMFWFCLSIGDDIRESEKRCEEIRRRIQESKVRLGEASEEK